MMSNLWSLNTPAQFWHCQPDPAPQEWRESVEIARPILHLPVEWSDIDALLPLVLGEGQFGSDHWQLSTARRAYYRVKPLLPRPAIKLLRQIHARHIDGEQCLGWPVEPRYVLFLWDVMLQLLLARGDSSIAYLRFWPHGKHWALVLTHDVETEVGLRHVRAVADLEERLGFRSLFNFVPERYPLDLDLLAELRARGFEAGVHGLRHDGKLFKDPGTFTRRAVKINQYMSALGATGFRSPLTMRQPEWMQDLEIEYDLSFFDTDPYEPIPGGTMCIWPFFVGHFVELPYTLAQDFTLTCVLHETCAQVWLNKVAFIRQYHGMALINTHPDYLREPAVWKLYENFLAEVGTDEGYWHALPQEVACWWRRRAAGDGTDIGEITLSGDGLSVA